jgi:hypothetical protein
VLGNVNTVYHKGLQKKRRKEKATETNYSGFRRLKMQRTITSISKPIPPPFPPSWAK